MATAKPIDETSDVFNCTICLEKFTRPKYLPCLHTFCEACLNTYIISTQSGKDKPNNFSCPVCRQEVKSHDLDAPIEEWAKLMPINHMIYSLMESSVIGKDQEEIKCSPCERDEENTTAIFWCVDCQESLCNSCKKAHNRLKMSAKHKLIPVSDIKTSEMTIRVPDIEEPCPVHKGELLKVYCQDHQEMCCVFCLSIYHRKCEDIKSFEQMTESMGDKSEQLTKHIKGIGKQLKSLVDKKQENIDTVKTQQEHISKEASSLVKQAKETLDSCLEKFKSKFSEIHKEQCINLEDAKDKLEIFQKSVLNCEKMLKAVTEHGSPKQIFITSEKIKKQLKIQSDAIRDFLKDDKNIEYNINLNEKFADATKLTLLAEVKVKTDPFVELSTLDKSALFYLGSGCTELQNQLKTATIERLGAVKLWDVNGSGRFTGGTFLKDGRLLCANYGTQALTVFDQDGVQLISHSLHYKPWDVAHNSANKIFVTSEEEKCIKIYYLLNKTFKELKTIKLQSSPNSINIIDECILVAVQGQIQNISSEGEVLQRVGVCDTYSYIAMTKLSEKVYKFYYSGVSGKEIICKTLDGKDIQRLELTDIAIARGLALDFAGNVYVCGRDSKNVFVISKDFKTSRVFISKLEGIANPYAMEFDKSGTKFFICDFYTGTLAMYSLSVNN